MKKILLITLCALFSCQLALAAEPSNCEARATEKNLKGAAKNSFMKKCEKDAAAATPAVNAECTAKAEEKKLKGAAKNSFMKKCEKDAAATAPAKQ